MMSLRISSRNDSPEGSKPEKLNESKCFPLFTNNGHRQDTSRMLKHIAEFFALEKDIRGRSAEERRLIRQREAGRSPMHSRSGYAQSVV
jgi:hypothetical protein